MGLKDRFATSDRLEREGIDLDLGDCIITLGRAGGKNTKFTAAMEKIMRQHGRALNTGAMSAERETEILREVYADTIVFNWRTRVKDEKTGEDKLVTGIENVLDDKGGVIPFNRENVISTFKVLPDLFIECKLTAENISFYRQSLLDQAVKN